MTEWDTIFIAGGSSLEDTLFAGPRLLALLDDRVVVVDEMIGRLSAIDTAGKLLWAVGSKGSGPQEFRGISDIAVTPDGTVWVLDFGNGRISEISRDGEFLGVIPLHHLPFPPTSIEPMRHRLIANSHADPDRPFVELDPKSLSVRRSFELPWPDTISEAANRRVVIAAGPKTTWAAAFVLGPGFMVWRGDVSRAFPYIEHISFARRPSPRITAMRADSARWGAVSIAAAGDELYMLFGGRPVRAAHPAEPTIWIDVYGFDGGYRRSYRLPFDSDAMATDGRTFYLLHTDLLPTLIALRPRTGP